MTKVTDDDASINSDVRKNKLFALFFAVVAHSFLGQFIILKTTSQIIKRLYQTQNEYPMTEIGSCQIPLREIDGGNF